MKFTVLIYETPGEFEARSDQQRKDAYTDWESIALLYEGLLRLAPTVGAGVGYAAALAEARGTEAGLAVLEQLPADVVSSYQPYWALRGHLLSARRPSVARQAYARAIELSDDPAVRAFVTERGGS